MNKVSEDILALLVRHLPERGRLLEVGSGSAHISVELVKRHPKAEISLNEINVPRLALSVLRAWRRGVFPSIIPGDINKYRVTRRYDLVWSSGLVQCFPPERHGAFAEKLRSLGNKIILVFPDVEQKYRNTTSTVWHNRIGTEGCPEYVVVESNLVRGGGKISEEGVITAAEEALGFRMKYVVLQD